MENNLRDKNFLLLNAVENGNIQLVNKIIKDGADVNFSASKWDITPLIIATRNGDIEMVKLLLDNGALINKTSSHNMSALMHACLIGKNDVSLYLIERGCDIEIQSNAGSNVLMYAAEVGNLEFVKLFLTKGMNIHQENNKGWTALTFAFMYNHKRVYDYLVDHGADVNKIEQAATLKKTYIKPQNWREEILLKMKFDKIQNEIEN